MTNIEQRLQPAWGYLGLGMIQDANDELEALPPELKTSQQALGLRAHIYHETQAWQLLREAGDYLVHQWPEDAQHWIWLGYGTRRCRSIAEAEQILLDALRLHDSEPLIHFNLACYAAQTGKLDLARERLGRAINLSPEIRLLALADPDLKSLWAELIQ